MYNTTLLLLPGSSLVRLDLSDNPLTEEVAGALADCLGRQPHLRHLNLNDTSLQDEGVEAVCKALAAPGAAQQLEVLELALNEISPTGIRYVVMAIANKQKLFKCVLPSSCVLLGRGWCCSCMMRLVRQPESARLLCLQRLCCHVDVAP